MMPTATRIPVHENGSAIVIVTADEPTMVQTYAMKIPDGFS